jgi:alpha-L-arabinofuranosidase
MTKGLLASGAVAAVCVVLILAVEGSRQRVVQGQSDNPTELIKNKGFEDVTGNLPSGWNFDQRAKRKGRAEVDSKNAKVGERRLLLQPTGENSDPANLLAIGQALPLNQVKGKKVEVSAWVSGEGGATAVVGLFALKRTGGIIERATVESDSSGAWQAVKTALEVPDSSEVAMVILLCEAKGTSGIAAFDEVSPSIAGESGMAAARTAESKQQLHAVVEINAARHIRKIPRTIYGTNLEWIYNGYGIWDEKSGKLNPDLIRLTKELNVSLLRYPGGFFADFYDWREGIGPRNSRPRAQHYPGGPKSPLNFGTDEVMEFADLVGADPHFIANIITGTPEQAAAWVRHTKSGGRRGVHYWELGNENYGKEPNSEYSVRGALTPEEYTKRFLAFAKEMRQADPSLRLMAVGGENYGLYKVVTHSGWNREVLSKAGSEMDLLAVHNAYYPLTIGMERPNVREVYRALFAAPVLIRANLQTLSKQIELYAPPDRREKIGLAITEWGPWFELNLKSPLVDHVKTLGSAIFVASVLKVFVENPRVEVANFFKLVDNLFMGWIGVKDGQYIAKAPYLAFSMFTKHFGEVLVESSTQSPRFATEALSVVDRVEGVDYLESLASSSGDAKTLYILTINKHFDQEIPASISVSGFSGVRSGKVWTLSGTGLDANTGTEMAALRGQKHGRQAEDPANPRFYRGKSGEVAIALKELKSPGSKLEYRFPPLSVTVIELSK